MEIIRNSQMIVTFTDLSLIENEISLEGPMTLSMQVESLAGQVLTINSFLDLESL